MGAAFAQDAIDLTLSRFARGRRSEGRGRAGLTAGLKRASDGGERARFRGRSRTTRTTVLPEGGGDAPAEDARHTSGRAPRRRLLLVEK